MTNSSRFTYLDSQVYALRRTKESVDSRDAAAVKALGETINAAAEDIGWDAYKKLYNLLYFGRDWNTERNA